MKNFKRGLDPKEAMSTGIISMLKDVHTEIELKKLFPNCRATVNGYYHFRYYHLYDNVYIEVKPLHKNIARKNFKLFYVVKIYKQQINNIEKYEIIWMRSANESNIENFYPRLYEGGLSGVGDKYAERAFGIPDNDDHKYRDTQYFEESELELVGQITQNWKGKDFAEPTNIFKNPKNLSDFKPFVRGIILESGDIYIADHSRYVIHIDILALLIKEGIIEGSVEPESLENRAYSDNPAIKKYVGIQRVGNKNIFGISEEINIDLNNMKYINAAQSKNPQFKFANQNVFKLEHLLKESKAAIQPDYNDMWIEFEFFNQYLSFKLPKSKFIELVKNAKTTKIPYDKIPKIYQRYNQDFKKLQSVKDEERAEWWKPQYLKMKKFEPQKQTDDYYYKLLDAVKKGKVNEPIIVLIITDEQNKQHMFICGGRNRATLSYIMKVPVDAIVLRLPQKENIQNIQKIINNLNT